MIQFQMHSLPVPYRHPYSVAGLRLETAFRSEAPERTRHSLFPNCHSELIALEPDLDLDKGLG